LNQALNEEIAEVIYEFYVNLNLATFLNNCDYRNYNGLLLVLLVIEDSTDNNNAKSSI